MMDFHLEAGQRKSLQERKNHALELSGPAVFFARTFRESQGVHLSEGTKKNDVIIREKCPPSPHLNQTLDFNPKGKIRKNRNMIALQQGDSTCEEEEDAKTFSLFICWARKMTVSSPGAMFCLAVADVVGSNSRGVLAEQASYKKDTLGTLTWMVAEKKLGETRANI